MHSAVLVSETSVPAFREASNPYHVYQICKMNKPPFCRVCFSQSQDGNRRTPSTPLTSSRETMKIDQSRAEMNSWANDVLDMALVSLMLAEWCDESGRCGGKLVLEFIARLLTHTMAHVNRCGHHLGSFELDPSPLSDNFQDFPARCRGPHGHRCITYVHVGGGRRSLSREQHFNPAPRWTASTCESG